MTDAARSITVTALQGIPEIRPGEVLGRVIAEGLSASGLTLQAEDILVVAQKIVSKAEGRIVDLRSVVPGARARELATITRKEPRFVELVLAQSTEVLRAQKDVLIVRHRRGYVMANAGIDRSNVPAADGAEPVLLLPEDPDASAAALRADLLRRTGFEIGVVISDSFGRPWRLGVVNIALGAAGVPALIDRRGETDRAGRRLEVTEVAVADAVAAAAGMVMGEAAEGVPAALLRGMHWPGPHCDARALIRPLEQDLFR
jgi:coenzyme F420-0:L-glutamate ligase/coenzyme F420-1:gamma-L-glutamate ligase